MRAKCATPRERIQVRATCDAVASSRTAISANMPIRLTRMHRDLCRVSVA